MCEHAAFHLYILPMVSIFIFDFAIINDAIMNILVAVSLRKSLMRVSLEKRNCRVVECVCDETKHTATPVHSLPTSRILVGPVTCFHRQTLPPDGRSCLYSWALSKPPAWPTPFALYGPSFSLGPRSLVLTWEGLSAWEPLHGPAVQQGEGGKSTKEAEQFFFKYCFKCFN